MRGVYCLFFKTQIRIFKTNYFMIRNIVARPSLVFS